MLLVLASSDTPRRAVHYGWRNDALFSEEAFWSTAATSAEDTKPPDYLMRLPFAIGKIMSAAIVSIFIWIGNFIWVIILAHMLV